jgi:hypothetical protein
LAEYDRASDAVSSALAFQAANLQHNRTLGGDIRPEVRIGISLGEVVIADGTLTGPDVVLAQRLEQLAEPGGVCISVQVRHALPGRLPFEYTNRGEQTVKGFVDPVGAYSVTLHAAETVPAPEPRARVEARTAPVKRRIVVAGALAIVVIAVGVMGLWRPWVPETEPADPAKMAHALPDKPSVAVLPFNNLSAEEEQAYFSDGVTEHIITDLSKVSGLFVIASESSFTYKGQPVKGRRVAEELGVRYVL